MTHEEKSLKKRKIILAALVVSAFVFFIAVASSGPGKNEKQNEAPAQQAAATPVPQPAAKSLPLAKPGETCDLGDCPAGTKVVTLLEQGEVFYACPTKELADYTNVIIGFAAAQVRLTGGTSMPNISPETGEPEYQGETKAIIDNLRHAAGVKTFDQAVAFCLNGKGGRKGTVMNNSPDNMTIWVMDQRTKVGFWMPKGFLKVSAK